MRDTALHDFESAAQGLRNRGPISWAGRITWAICAMACIAMIYAFFAQMDIVVSAQGKIIPTGRSKLIQALETGIVHQIHVRDGQKVKAGEVLIELDSTINTAERTRLIRELWEAQAEETRLRALLAGQASLPSLKEVPGEIIRLQQALLTHALLEQRSKLAALDAEITKRQADRDGAESSLIQSTASLPLVEKKNQRREELVKVGYLAPAGLVETHLEVLGLKKELSLQRSRLAEAQAGLRAALQQRAQAQAEFQARTATSLAEANRKYANLQQELIKANQRRELQTLKAPIDGTVQQLAITTQGGVVTPAQPLAMIIPDLHNENTLEVDAQIQNKDIGHIHPGQRVVTKVETFDFTRFGYFEGEVQWVGNDAINDPKLGPIYPVRIRLNTVETPNSVNGKKGTLAPGMNVTADIHIAKRRMISYFLSPLLRHKDEALRER